MSRRLKTIKKVALKSNAAQAENPKLPGVPKESRPEINPVLDSRHL